MDSARDRDSVSAPYTTGFDPSLANKSAETAFYTVPLIFAYVFRKGT